MKARGVLTSIVLVGLLVSLSHVSRWEARAAEPALSGAGSTRTGTSRLERPLRVVLVDVDDTDADRVEDRRAPRLGPAAVRSLVELRASETVPNWGAPSVGPLRWIAGDGRVLPAGQVPPAGTRVFLQGTRPGRGSVLTARGPEDVFVMEVRAYDDAHHEVSLAHSWASLSRTVPEELMGAKDAPGAIDGDALSYVLIGPSAGMPHHVEFVSEGVSERYRDSLLEVPLRPVVCPPGIDQKELECRSTPSIRLTSDAVDRHHPAIAERSLLAEVGGRLRLLITPENAVTVRVGGPRALETNGPGRYRGRLRARVVRVARGGTPAIGGTDAEARDLLAQEVFATSGVWGQCGIHFGAPQDLDVDVVDPPEGALLEVGCGATLPASGGELALSLGGEVIRLKTSPGQTPESVASKLAQVLEARGHVVRRFLNARAENRALSTVDLLVSDKKGKPARWSAEGTTPLSTDPSLSVCIGSVNLEDGLDHFTDENAASGTLEERTMLRVLGDDDPKTIDWFVVPVFAGMGRIGESFIWSPGASIENALILDRSGVRAGARSFTLAHELGHILLDMPGHPDDYGVDQPSALMDADASDGTIFGPRRLSLEDCRRALRQSGPGAPQPLLEPWPLVPEPASTPR